MEAHARAPDPLTNDGDVARNWHSWKEDFIIFMKVTGYIDKPNEVRANLLKNRIGKVGIDAIQNMTFDNPQDKDDMDILITKLEKYFNPPKNEVVERYQFFTKCKKQNESIEQYINNLREKAKSCNFKEMTDSLIRDKIILETHDKILRKKLFEVDDLDLSKLVTIYNDYNISIEKMRQVTQENKTESTALKSKPTGSATKGCCWRCGCQHPQGKCPAWQSKCTKCGDVNHFTQCCRGFKSNPNNSNTPNKINKNVLAHDPSQQQGKIFSKTLPNIPTNSVFDNSASCDDTFDLALHLFDICSTNSSLSNNNTANPSTRLHEKSQYSHSNISEPKPDWTLDLDIKDKNSEPKTTPSGIYEKWNDTFSRNISTENVIYSNHIYNEESDEERSTLYGTSTLQRLQYSLLMIFILTISHTLRQVLTSQVDHIKRHLTITLNMFVNIIFCSYISRNRNRQ